MFRKSSGLFMSSLFVCALAACTVPTESDSESAAAVTSTHAASRAQMNDLSVLYPLAKSAVEMNSAYLTVSSHGAKGQLLPEKIFDAAVTDFPKALNPVGGDQVIVSKDLRLMAFRLDPCFANLGPITDPSGCKSQIRLVFQPLVADGDTVSSFDMAVHVFYSLTLKEFFDATNAIAALRAANSTGDLGPLAVHPVMVSQGLGGAMAKGLNAIVLKYAGSSNLTRVAAFERSAELQISTAWSFQAFDVANGTPTASPIPTLADRATTQQLVQPLHGDLSSSFAMTSLFPDPQTTSKDDPSLLLSASAATATTADQQAAYDGAIRIEDPHANSPNTIDCASCHTAAIARRLGEEAFSLKPDANAQPFAADSSISAADLGATIPATELLNHSGMSSTNVHSFSYNEEGPMIHQRVINETAAILSYVNSQKP